MTESCGASWWEAPVVGRVSLPEHRTIEVGSGVHSIHSLGPNDSVLAIECARIGVGNSEITVVDSSSLSKVDVAENLSKGRRCKLRDAGVVIGDSRLIRGKLNSVGSSVTIELIDSKWHSHEG